MTTGEGGIVVTNNQELAKQMVCCAIAAVSPPIRGSVLSWQSWVSERSDAGAAQVFLRGHAMSGQKRFWHTDVGFNYRHACPLLRTSHDPDLARVLVSDMFRVLGFRLSNLLCAVGVAQLERFPELFKGRMRVVDAYRKSLEGFGGVRINPGQARARAHSFLHYPDLC
eukprot:1553810-Rhodomonas_salina.2